MCKKSNKTVLPLSIEGQFFQISSCSCQFLLLCVYPLFFLFPPTVDCFFVWEDTHCFGFFRVEYGQFQQAAAMMKRYMNAVAKFPTSQVYFFFFVLFYFLCFVVHTHKLHLPYKSTQRVNSVWKQQFLSWINSFPLFFCWLCMFLSTGGDSMTPSSIPDQGHATPSWEETFTSAAWTKTKMSASTSAWHPTLSAPLSAEKPACTLPVSLAVCPVWPSFSSFIISWSVYI